MYKLNSELDKMCIDTEFGKIKPIYECSDYIATKDGDYELVDFVLIKSAEEVYDELLNPTQSKPTEVEILKSEIDFLSIINADLESKALNQQSDIDYLLILQEG